MNVVGLRRDPASVASHWINAYGDNQAAERRGIKRVASLHNLQEVHLDFGGPFKTGIHLANQLHLGFLIQSLTRKMLGFDLRHDLAGAIRKQKLVVRGLTQKMSLNPYILIIDRVL